MSLTALLRENPDPTDAEIRQGLPGNCCRCNGYQGIVAARIGPPNRRRRGNTLPSATSEGASLQ